MCNFHPHTSVIAPISAASGLSQPVLTCYLVLLRSSCCFLALLPRCHHFHSHYASPRLFPIIWNNLVFLCLLSELPRSKLPNRATDIFIARSWINLPFTCSVPKKAWPNDPVALPDRQTDRQRLEPNLAHSAELHSLNWSRHKSKFGIMYLQSGLQRYFLGHL